MTFLQLLNLQIPLIVSRLSPQSELLLFDPECLLNLAVPLHLGAVELPHVLLLDLGDFHPYGSLQFVASSR